MKVETKKIIRDEYTIELSNTVVLTISTREQYKDGRLSRDSMMGKILTKYDENVIFDYNAQPTSNPSGNIGLFVYRELVGAYDVEAIEKADESYKGLEIKLLEANKYGAISIPEALEIIGGHIEEFLGEIK